MTLSLRFAARSDVGLQRDLNEDSGYAGPSLLAIADGMGGHAAGEVASSVAVSTLARLEDDVPSTELLDMLAQAVNEANEAISQLVDKHPQLDGMGTTLTALLWAGRKIGLAHVGDSRAYLLRDGELQQITHDHTFVQQLIDEGRISEEEARRHPQRSVLLRALDGRGNPESDLQVREVRVGDRYLLCSDGLSSVVPHDQIASALARPDPNAAVESLVDLALQAGGPDNITCIVADVVESDGHRPEYPMVVGAAAERRRRRTDSTAEIDLSEAGDDGRADTGPAGRLHQPHWLRRSIVLAVLLAVLAGGGIAAYAWSQRQFYVGADTGEVAIFKGLPQQIGGLSLSRRYEGQGILLSDLPAFDRDRVQDTIFAGGLGEARRIVDRLRQQAADCQHSRQLAAQQAAAQAAAQRAAQQKAAQQRGGATKPPTSGATTAAPTSPAATSTAPAAGDCGS